MAWTLGSIRIYPQKFGENTSAILPRLQPLSGGTIVQSFGYDTRIIQLSVTIVGFTNKNTLRGYANDGGAAHELLHSVEGSYGNYSVKSFNSDRTMSTCQTIDPTQAEDAPVFEAEIELYPV
jgi:hypothetical protein